MDDMEEKAIQITYPLAFKKGQLVERMRIRKKIEYILKPREKKGNKGRTENRVWLLNQLLEDLNDAFDEVNEK